MYNQYAYQIDADGMDVSKTTTIQAVMIGKQATVLHHTPVVTMEKAYAHPLAQRIAVHLFMINEIN